MNNNLAPAQLELLPQLINIWGYGLFWYAGPVDVEDADTSFLGLPVKQFNTEKQARAWQKENQANGLQSGTASNSLH